MASNLQESTTTQNAMVDALTALAASGYIRIYDSTGGTGQPATVDTAIGSQVLLGELRFANPSDAGAANGARTRPA